MKKMKFGKWKQKSRGLVFLLLFAVISCSKGFNSKEHPLLADKDQPIYTTYAAHMERSNYTVDQGYHLMYYDPDEKLEFSSEQGGNMGVIFRKDGKNYHQISDLYEQVKIHYSYPDMLSYEYQPVEGIRCQVQFLVQSSSSAILEMEIRNEGEQEQELEVLPYLSNFYRPFTEVSSEQGHFRFMNEKYPDSWTLGHQLPHVDTTQNRLYVSGDCEAFTACNAGSRANVRLPYSIHMDRESMFQLIGRPKNEKGERINVKPEEVLLQLFLNGKQDHLLTESCPLNGKATNPLTKEFYRFDLGNFKELAKGDQYSLEYYWPKEQLYDQLRGSIPDMKEKSYERKDLALEKEEVLHFSGSIEVEECSEGNLIRWEKQACNVDIYRRYKEEGLFTRIAKNVAAQEYIDAVEKGSLVRYVLLPVEEQSGKRGMHSYEVSNVKANSFQDFMEQGKACGEALYADYLLFQKKIRLAAGESHRFRMVRVTEKKNVANKDICNRGEKLLQEDLDVYRQYNQKLLKGVDAYLKTDDEEIKMLVASCFNMMRQVFYPPEGNSSYNYYVFSREPVWGWGHGGQVFHESITMLSYGLLFPGSAMDSQRVYSERQYENGYINYRSGSWLDEIIEHNGQLTSSAPWYSWLNWEIYSMTKDKRFLEEMYQSSKKFYQFYTESRDSDGDGLYEWGGHAILESVRDALVAVWDEVGWPSNFESLDLNCMMVNEAKALENMARELGLEEEAENWKAKHEKLSRLINQHCWDPENAFYYNVDKKDNDFSFRKEGDLKRDEIIGFLPLWAGIASKEQAQGLVDKLTDPDQFWRKNGVPSLSASDSYYNAKGYWNGPVWVEWNYLVMRGLLNYGYEEEARELVKRNAGVMIQQLKENHNLWEFYSPDDDWAGYHKTYIWAGIINRMLLDVGIIEAPQSK